MIILDLLIIMIITTDLITLSFFNMSLIIIRSLICSLAADSQWELAVDSLIRQEGEEGGRKT